MSLSRLLRPESALLLVVDVQEKFAPAINRFEHMTSRIRVLLQACGLLQVPVLVSEQYVKGLGHTVPQVLEVLPEDSLILEKTAFGCGADPAILQALTESGRRQIMVCGIEAHVCVNQTVHQLLTEDYQVHLIRDAVSSRHPADIETALAKMTQSGAIPSCVEMALFELMTDAKHPLFKEVQALIK
jgi:nicotinamidase-related amidase